MDWMRDAEDDNDNELDPLLALANQAETQATPAAPPQAVRRCFFANFESSCFTSKFQL